MNGLVSIALMLVSLIIIIGFLSNYQFVRTGFPGILFLILLGFLFGPVFKLVKSEEVAGYAPFLADLATVLILFEGGVTINIKKTIRETPRALLLTIIHIIFCTVVVSLFMIVIGVEPLYATLFGIMISGNSAAVIVPITQRIQISEEAVSVITLESTLNNVFQVVSFIAIARVITAGELNLIIVAQNIAASFCVGGVIGLFIGMFWLNVLLKIKREPFAPMLTIAILFLAFYTSEYLGGNGALSSLLFGVVLGNEKEIFKIFGQEPKGETEGSVVDAFIIRFESELAFLIRTFFFVYIGLTINITDYSSIIYGVILSVLLLLTRVSASIISTLGSSLKSERNIISIVLSRGLSEAVLSVMMLSYGLLYSTMFQNIAFIVIIITNILCTIGVFKFAQVKKI